MVSNERSFSAPVASRNSRGLGDRIDFRAAGPAARRREPVQEAGERGAVADVGRWAPASSALFFAAFISVAGSAPITDFPPARSSVSKQQADDWQGSTSTRPCRTAARPGVRSASGGSSDHAVARARPDGSGVSLAGSRNRRDAVLSAHRIAAQRQAASGATSPPRMLNSQARGRRGDQSPTASFQRPLPTRSLLARGALPGITRLLRRDRRLRRPGRSPRRRRWDFGESDRLRARLGRRGEPLYGVGAVELGVVADGPEQALAPSAGGSSTRWRISKTEGSIWSRACRV